MAFDFDIQDSSHAPIRGHNVSVPEDLLDPSFSPDMLNVLSTDGALIKRTGYTELLTGLSAVSPNPVMEGIEYGDSSGVLHSVIFTTDKMIEYTSTPAWVSRTPSGGYLTGTSANHIFAYPVGGVGADYLYFTNGVDKLKYWTGSSTFADLTTFGFTTLKAKTLIGYKGHLVLGNIIDEDSSKFPYRIRWSKAGDPTYWAGKLWSQLTGAEQAAWISEGNVGESDWVDNLAPVSAGFANLIEDETNSAVMRFLPIKDVLACYKENSIYNITYMGDPRYFVPRMQVADRGAISPKGVCSVGDAHLVVSNDNIYIYDGFYLQDPPIGNRIKKKFFADLNWDARDRIYCKAFPQKFEAWILYPTGTSTVPNAAYCWNWLYDSWTPHEFGDTGYSLMNWVDTFNQMTALYGVSGNVFKLFDGYTDNGTNISAYARTKLNEYPNQNVPGIQRKTSRRIEIQSAGTNPNVSIGGTDNLLSAPQFETARAITGSAIGIKRADSQQSGRYLTLKVSDSSNGEPFQWAGHTIYAETRGAV